MNAEFISALDALEKEKNLSKEVLIEAIEAALAAAYKKNFSTDQNVRVDIDRETGDINVYAQLLVVDNIEDEDKEILIEDAQEINKKAKIGDILEEVITPDSFGRIAAQTAKQVVVQRIREAERTVIFDDFIEKEDEVVTATVQRVDRKNVFVDLGKTEGYLPPSEQMFGENYYPNDRLKVYVVEVQKTNRGAQIIVSRSHPGLVKRLFESEVPEINEGIIEIVSIAREAGQRTKMAVYSEDNDIDAIGACVGQRGIRVERVVDELHGEKIDIVNYSDDPVEFIANALSPAKVVMIYLYEDEKVASVVVPDNQLSLAIGRQGQNARLAAKLTGWKIDIKSQSQIMEEEMNKEDNEDSSDEDDELMQSSDEMTDDGEDLEDEFDLDFDDIDDLEGISEEEEDI
jgi:N utilization substance protein A